MRLLLCEDERSLSRAIETILKRNNYSVVVANGYIVKGVLAVIHRVNGVIVSF